MTALLQTSLEYGERVENLPEYETYEEPEDQPVKIPPTSYWAKPKDNFEEAQKEENLPTDRGVKTRFFTRITDVTTEG